MAVTLTISHRCAESRARTGVINTPHGPFETPAFMPVGTKAALKGLVPTLVADTGSQCVLANTYHLLLRPGPERVRELGGLHRFMVWPGPILTDSGGYQAYSMADINRVTDDGVRFKSIVDGAWIDLSPELAIETQHALGADIIMAFDDCPPSVDPRTFNQTRLRLAAQRTTASAEYDHDKRLDDANERTIRWLERCAKRHRDAGRHETQALFGIVQGGVDIDRRSWSAERVCAVDLPGYAIGGVAVGEGFEEIVRVVDHTAALLPDDKPRYLMGVGYEKDIVAAVRAGVDMFDCVLPTRNGRNANAFTTTGQIRLKNARFAADDGPIDPECDCIACRPAAHDWPPAGAPIPHPARQDAGAPCFSRAYIRHLFLADEMLGPILVSLHNVRHFQRLLVDIRRTIREDDWSGFARRWPVAREGVRAPGAG
ncbi:MAG: tRNA guanosine(34) transglycosylase Tgt [Phycisphaerales bacterium]